MTHPEPHDLTALAYGLIEGVERERLLEHMGECDACREVYDARRDEHAGVRDSILADARSGSAEAKALDRTLKMLNDMEVEEKRGRLIRVPGWLIAVEVAAVVMVALGLFFVMKPEDEDLAPVQIAVEDRAPAQIEQGVAFVQDSRGDWRQAEAVPVDEWVKTGDETFDLKLSNGSRAKLTPGSVFRVLLASSDVPVVYMLRGAGELDTSRVSHEVEFRAGANSFYARPGARFELMCKSNEMRPRSWTTPASIRARVLDGDVLVRTEGEIRHLPLQTGEMIEQINGRLRVMLSAQAISYASEFPNAGQFKVDPVPHEYFAWTPGAPDADKSDGYRLLIPRLEEWSKHWGDKISRPQQVIRLRDELAGLRQVVHLNQEMEVELTRMRPYGWRDALKLEFEDLGVTLTLTSSVNGLALRVVTPDETVTYPNTSFESLSSMLSPEIAALLDGVGTELENGKLRVTGYENPNKGNVKATLTTTDK